MIHEHCAKEEDEVLDKELSEMSPTEMIHALTHQHTLSSFEEMKMVMDVHWEEALLLHVAVAVGSRRIVQMLCARGIDVDKVQAEVLVIRQSGEREDIVLRDVTSLEAAEALKHLATPNRPDTNEREKVYNFLMKTVEFRRAHPEDGDERLSSLLTAEERALEIKKKLNIDLEEPLLDTFRCAMKRKLYHEGRLYFFDNQCCFVSMHGWCALSFFWKDVIGIEKGSRYGTDKRITVSFRVTPDPKNPTVMVQQKPWKLVSLRQRDVIFQTLLGHFHRAKEKHFPDLKLGDDVPDNSKCATH